MELRCLGWYKTEIWLKLLVLGILFRGGFFSNFVNSDFDFAAAWLGLEMVALWFYNLWICGIRVGLGGMGVVLI